MSLQRPLSRINWRITWEKRCNLKEKKQIRCNLVICPCVRGTSATSTAHRLSAVRHGRRRKAALSLVVGVQRRSIKQNVWNILRHDICKYLILQNTSLYNFSEQRHKVWQDYKLSLFYKHISLFVWKVQFHWDTRTCSSILLDTILQSSATMFDTILGKHHHKNFSVHLGIARLGGGSKPLPGWFVAPIFRRNVLVQTGICMILPENRCHRVPVWQRGGGIQWLFGQCPNEQI